RHDGRMTGHARWRRRRMRGQEPELGALPHVPLELLAFSLDPMKAPWLEGSLEFLLSLPWPHPVRLATPRSRRTRSSARSMDAPSGSPEDTRRAPCGVQRTSTSAKSGDGRSEE